MTNNSQYCKIFISHSSKDASIGEAFLDLLISFGIPKEDIFYSSKYHNGVELGQDFNNIVKDNLLKAKLVIFLMTRNFYASECCLNEMGAVWISNKDCIPVLFRDISLSDMKGFIDNRRIVLEPKYDQIPHLHTYLRRHEFLTSHTIQNIEDQCLKFTKAIEQNVTNVGVLYNNTATSTLDDKILATQFTDDELILFSYFIENQTDYLFDGVEVTEHGIGQTDTMEIWSKQFDRFNYNKARRLLERSGYLSIVEENIYINYDESDTFEVGAELSIDVFRDLLTLGEEAKTKVIEVANKHRKKSADLESQNLNIENLINNNKLTDEEILLINYLIDTGSDTLGDRWMATGEIEKIKEWEADNFLKGTLSSNYQKALGLFKMRKFLNVKSCTSYGNPREFVLKDQISDKLLNLNSETNSHLLSIMKKHYIF